MMPDEKAEVVFKCQPGCSGPADLCRNFFALLRYADVMALSLAQPGEDDITLPAQYVGRPQ